MQFFNYSYQKILLLIWLQKILARTGFLREHVKYYSNSWIVQFTGNSTAYEIAQREGFNILEKITQFRNLYHLSFDRHPKRSKYENRRLTEVLSKYSEVTWLQQVAIEGRELKGTQCPGKLAQFTSRYENVIRDQLFNKQWYLHDCRSDNNIIVYDLNVIRVWFKYKIFGIGVTVLVVDDGLETTHPDLKDNYEEFYSCNLVDKKPTPDPDYKSFKSFAHGTMCAGIIAMRAGNNVCGAGIAPMVQLGAVRLISAASGNDYTDSLAFSFKVTKGVDIINCSWGSPDDGSTMKPLGEMSRFALNFSVRKGRRGKGVIYVFPAGNGKKKGDSCGADEFVTSIYTIAVAAVDYNGNFSSYSERCAGVMVTAYGGAPEMRSNIVTTALHGYCTTEFWGTSAAVPIVSGIIALVLEANSELTWRDVQHAIAWTSQKAPLQHNKGWKKNGAGFEVHHDFGFGMIDAYKMVTFARTIKSIPEMNSCVLKIALPGTQVFKYNQPLKISFTATGCKNSHSAVNYAEHVQLVVNAKYPQRGAFWIALRSPAGTFSYLLEPRRLDKSRKPLTNWLLDSVHFWGEDPYGAWSIFICVARGKRYYKVEVSSLTLIIHGTNKKPAHYDTSRAYYDTDDL